MKTNTKGTTLKYSKVIKELKQMATPTKINSPAFAKKHNVSTNLMLALQQMGHIKNDKKAGYSWNPKSKGTDVQIAEKARVKMNEMTNNRKPTRERPTGQRAYKGRVTKTKKAAFKKTSFKKLSTTPTKRTYNKRVPTKPTDAKVQLAKRFSDLGEYDHALKLLS